MTSGWLIGRRCQGDGPEVKRDRYTPLRSRGVPPPPPVTSGVPPPPSVDRSPLGVVGSISLRHKGIDMPNTDTTTPDTRTEQGKIKVQNLRVGDMVYVANEWVEGREDVHGNPVNGYWKQNWEAVLDIEKGDGPEYHVLTTNSPEFGSTKVHTWIAGSYGANNITWMRPRIR